jgi:hypothetical protein
VPGGTPYITTAMLLSMPASIAWNVIPTLTVSGPEQVAQLAQECWKATSAIDRYCHQPLRSVAVTDPPEIGPGRGRISVDRQTGIAKLITRRWPVTEVLAVQVSPARAFPPTYTLVQASQCLIGRPVVASAGPVPATGPDGGNVIEVAPGNIGCGGGSGGSRGLQRVMWSYSHGWPHTSLTVAAAEGAETISVDDVTGWAVPQGFSGGFAYDSTLSEGVEVISAVANTPVQLPGVAGTVQAGPGTLTLSGPLEFGHAAGIVVSALPPDVIRGAALQAAVQALEGIDAIATQSLSGQMAGGTGELATEVEMILDDYRVIM